MFTSSHPARTPHKILKFGGSSVGTPARIKNVIEIIRDTHSRNSRLAVVVSAFGGVTDQLIALGKMAMTGKSEQQHSLAHHARSTIIERHACAVEQLLSFEKQSKALKTVDIYFEELHATLEGIFLTKELSAESLDTLMSFGERLSAFIISEALREHIPEACFLDARTIIKTDDKFGRAKVDFTTSTSLIQKQFHEHSSVPIITGFIGSSKENKTTTLGRGGSDYTASIIGMVLGVDAIEIWTDVDGMMTADPKKERNAFPIAEMSYREAMEMSHFGAKVIYPPTLVPALEKNIPLYIKNSFNPAIPGTLIGFNSPKGQSPLRGISSIDDIVLLKLQPSLCNMSQRALKAVAEKNIPIVLVPAESSPEATSFAILTTFLEAAKEAIDEELKFEIHVQENLSIIAIVGEEVGASSDIAEAFFELLIKNGIEVIAQGRSQLNISAVIKNEDEAKAIAALHEAFFSPSNQIEKGERIESDAPLFELKAVFSV